MFDMVTVPQQHRRTMYTRHRRSHGETNEITTDAKLDSHFQFGERNGLL